MRRQARATSVITINTASGATAKTHAFPLRTPVLALRFGTAQVQLALSASDRVTAAEVEFARQLAKEAHDFARTRGSLSATSCQRWAGSQSGSSRHR